MMECNRYEAIRAKDLAEKKMQNRDFLGARRMALKAQRLFPDIENISQMLTICEVHCSAGVQAKGEMNWYGILQVEPTEDDLSIKKQYRKLAILLHPDKNQLTGAEEAFKLVVEAYNILSDQTKRNRYDMKMNADIRTTTPVEQSQQVGDIVNAKKSCSEATFNSLKLQKEHSPACPPTKASWNACPTCHMKYQNFLDTSYTSLPCHHCVAPSVAPDLDAKPLPQSTNPGNMRNYFGKHQEQYPLNQFKDTNQQNQFANASDKCKRQSTNAEHKVRPTNVILDAKVDTKDDTSKDAEFMQNTISEVKQAQNSTKHANSNAGQKRVRRLILESSDSDDIGPEDLAFKGDGTPTKTFTPISTPRRSTRLGRKDDYDEVGSEDGYSTTKLFSLSSTPQRSTRRKKTVASSEVGSKDGNTDFVDSPCSKKISDSSVNADWHDKELSHEVANREDVVDSSTNVFSKQKKLAWLQDILHDGRKKMKRCKRWTRMKKRKPSTTPQCNSNNLADVRKLCYPDPEFWDFDKSRSASQFAVNQIWATYDNKDGMPRFYARIKEVYGPDFKVRFTWLEHNPGNECEEAWTDKDLPIACGNYSLGASDVVENQLMFSHLVTWQKGKKRFSYDIYPKVGEVWALFKDWSIGWSSDAGNNKNYRYEVVEVISEFAKNAGISVIPLVKIEGFVSLFMRAEGKKGAPVLIPPRGVLA